MNNQIGEKVKFLFVLIWGYGDVTSFAAIEVQTTLAVE